jgi:hypothetical protein
VHKPFDGLGSMWHAWAEPFPTLVAGVAPLAAWRWLTTSIMLVGHSAYVLHAAARHLLLQCHCTCLSLNA